MSLLFSSKQFLFNLPSWRTHSPVLTIESDDWGSIRMPSNEIRESLECSSIDLGKGKDHYRYSLYDTMASKDDFEQLFSTLMAYKDINGNHPVFTAMTLVANPDFERIADTNFTQYFYEPLPKTLKRYGLDEAFGYWIKGAQEHLFVPEFHGREHLNIATWMRRLKANDKPTRTAFDARMWAVGNSSKINYQAAFDLEEASDLEAQHEVISTGLRLFEQLFEKKPDFLFLQMVQSITPCLKRLKHRVSITYPRQKYKRKYLGMGKQKNASTGLEKKTILANLPLLVIVFLSQVINQRIG